MDDKGQGQPQDEFNLEDLLKEFGGAPGDVPPEDIPEDDEDIRIWNGIFPEKKEETQLPGDTVRLDAVVQAVREAEKPTDDSDMTIRFTPMGEVEEPPFTPVVTPPEEKAEPFTDDWEPDYEEPISDYIPPQPIVFRPKNRLRELKKKLIEGPERRYY
jgi:hypothetical protein